jgi:signal transduction histidine kinase
MLIKQKLTYGSLAIGLFIVLVSGIVLIDNNTNLTKTLRLNMEWSKIVSLITSAREDEKNYFKGDQSAQSYLVQFQSDIIEAKNLSKADVEAQDMFNDYLAYFQGMVAKKNITDQTIKTLRTKGDNLQRLAVHRIEFRQKQAVGIQKKIYGTFLVAFILVIVVSIGGGFFISRVVSVPVDKIFTGIRKISAGEAGAAIEITTDDEIGELATIFNKLTKEVVQAKQDLTKKERELELQINKKIKELKAEEAQLIQTERAAAVEKLSAAVSARLKVSLNNIKNLLAQFKEKYLSPVTPEDKKTALDIKNMEKEIAHLMRMGANILTYSKVTVLKLESKDINRIIEDVLLLKQKEGFLDNIKTVRRLNPQIPRIPLDEELINQALDNLITNACQAMPMAGELIVSTISSNEEVEIRINDNGAGIAEDNLSKIFDPFFTTLSEGSGLGLTVVKEIVTEHRGSIAVQSSVGKGTIFIIKLPVKYETKTQTAPQDVSNISLEGGAPGNPESANTKPMTTRQRLQLYED